MPKKKETKLPSLQILPPEEFIKTKARALHFGECTINPRWEEEGEAYIIVTRMHITGNVTVAIFDVDIWCLGVKGAMVKYNLDSGEYESFKDYMYLPEDYESIDYYDAHSIIYGALKYAGKQGLKPSPDFELARYILEEDTKEIPLKKYKFGGHKGRPLLSLSSRFEIAKYAGILDRTIGQDNYDLDYIKMVSHAMANGMREDFYEDVLAKGHDKYDDWDDWDDWDDDDYYEDNPNFIHTDYAYNHPEYPKKLTLTHPELNAFFDPANNFSLPKKTIDSILSLPRETLLEDLEEVILYSIGEILYQRKPKKGKMKEIEHYAVIHALFFLGELKDEESLDTILEVLRQDSLVSDRLLGYDPLPALLLTLYYTGRNQLPKLFDFIQEPNLDPEEKGTIFPLINIINEHEPERRDELIGWMRNALMFFTENNSDSTVFDTDLASHLIAELIEMKAKELLPEIKQLMDTGRIDEDLTGDYPQVKKDIQSKKKMYENQPLLTIYQRYKKRKKESEELPF